VEGGGGEYTLQFLYSFISLYGCTFLEIQRRYRWSVLFLLRVLHRVAEPFHFLDAHWPIKFVSAVQPAVI
jgi:hypothetical protein